MDFALNFWRRNDLRKEVAQDVQVTNLDERYDWPGVEDNTIGTQGFNID